MLDETVYYLEYLFRENLDVGLVETERVKAEWEDDLISVTASTIGITYCEPDQLKELWEWTDRNNRQFDIHAPAVFDQKYLAERRGWEGSLLNIPVGQIGFMIDPVGGYRLEVMENPLGNCVRCHKEPHLQ